MAASRKRSSSTSRFTSTKNEEKSEVESVKEFVEQNFVETFQQIEEAETKPVPVIVEEIMPTDDAGPRFVEPEPVSITPPPPKLSPKPPAQPLPSVVKRHPRNIPKFSQLN